MEKNYELNEPIPSKIKTIEQEISRDKAVSYLTQGMELYLIQNKYTKISIPAICSITGSCENIDTMFTTDFFGDNGFLMQSGQLRLEMKTAYLDKVYALIQSFRKENVRDTRRLALFDLLELEQKGGLFELTDSVEKTLKSGINYLLDNAEEDLNILGVDIKKFENFKIDKVKYEDAIKLLNKNGFPELKFGDDLSQDTEAKLTDLLGPVFCYFYPEELKFWNMRRNCEDPRVVESADLLLPNGVGESAGMSARQTEYDLLKEKLLKSNMYHILTTMYSLDINDFTWYLDFHKDKQQELHSGVGIGIQRVVKWALDFDTIQDASTFPTYKGSLW